MHIEFKTQRLSFEEASERVATYRTLLAEYRAASYDGRAAIKKSVEQLVMPGVYQCLAPDRDGQIFHVSKVRLVGRAQHAGFVAQVQRILETGIPKSAWFAVPFIGELGFLTPIRIRGYVGPNYQRIGTLVRD